MPKRKKYSAAVIGCGRIASTFDDDPLREHPATHAGAYSSSNKIEIVSASDCDKSQLSAFGKKWGCKKLYTDYKAMLVTERPDIVSVCLPTAFHCESVVFAAKAGAKAIFCEKPLASSLKEADKMIAACRKSKTKLIINHTRRWDTGYTLPKKLIDQGKIGKIHTITGYCPNTLSESGSHMFDMMLYYGGSAEYVYARPDLEIDKKQHVKEPGADGFISFRSGAAGFYAGSGTKDYLIFEIDIVGSAGRIRITENGRNIMLYKSATSENYGNYKELSLQKQKLPRPKNRMIAAVEDIVSCIETGRESFSPGEAGRNALELIAAFRLSIKGNGKKVSLPLKNRTLSVV